MRPQNEPLYDFACSWDFHRFYSSQDGGKDPGDNIPEPIEEKPPAIAELSQFLLEKIKRLDDLQGRMLFLTNKLNEHLDKKKGKPSKY